MTEPNQFDCVVCGLPIGEFRYCLKCWEDFKSHDDELKMDAEREDNYWDDLYFA